MKARPNAQRSTLNVQRSTLELPNSRTLELPNFRTAPLPRRGFTLFELLGVLTLIGVVLVILLGAYGSWGTAHAVNGAARVVEAGLQQARTLARTQRAFVGFDYGTRSTNDSQSVTGFQIFVCTNENAEVDAELRRWSSDPTALDLQHTQPAAPFQRLSGHVRLGFIQETDMTSATPQVGPGVTLIFRPDGSVWSWDDRRAHYLCIQTRESFATETTPQPLSRILRVDLTTGLVTVIGEP